MPCKIPIPPNSDFTLSNLPLGVFSTAANPTPRVGTRIGDTILDLSTFSLANPNLPTSIFTSPTLSPFANLPHPIRATLRPTLQSKLTSPDLNYETHLLPHLTSAIGDDAKMHLPFTIGDYTDFYAGLHHARSVGTMFRGAANALQPNYLHLPVGYHGRSSSIVVSGTPVTRPRGQLGPPPPPRWAATEKLDFELELGCFVAGPDTELGETVTAEMAMREKRVFGYVLVNDWSSRDVQSWEYVPLGPFTSKSFATTVSPWVVLPEALEGAVVAALEGAGGGGGGTEGKEKEKEKGEVLPYLKVPDGMGGGVLDVKLQVEINGHTVTSTSGRNLIWTFEQMIAQQTVGGCNLRTGDLLASGTISGEGNGEAGCLLEATKNGTVKLEGSSSSSSSSRTWLEDGDEVVFSGWFGEGESRVGFGECSGVVRPAKTNYR